MRSSPDRAATSSSRATPSTDSSTRGSHADRPARSRRASRCRSCTPTCVAPEPSPAATTISTGCTTIADWSFRGNAVDVPTDCPTRERLAWTGDYQIFAPTATRLYDVLGFSRKWLRSVRDDQLDDGRIANFSPGRAPHQAPPRRPVRDDDGLGGLGRRDRGRAVGALRVLR